jgi:hypothetical protein
VSVRGALGARLGLCCSRAEGEVGEGGAGDVVKMSVPFNHWTTIFDRQVY